MTACTCLVRYALSLGAIWLMFAPSVTCAADDLFVKVRSTKLRSAPQHWAPAAQSLSLGDKLTPTGESSAGWVKARTKNGAVGYVHESTLTERRVNMRSASATGGAESASDVVLAGKGFNKQVEKEYAASNPNLDFAAVDAAERIRVDDRDVLAFLKSGGLDATN